MYSSDGCTRCACACLIKCAFVWSPPDLFVVRLFGVGLATAGWLAHINCNGMWFICSNSPFYFNHFWTSACGHYSPGISTFDVNCIARQNRACIINNWKKCAVNGISIWNWRFCSEQKRDKKQWRGSNWLDSNKTCRHSVRSVDSLALVPMHGIILIYWWTTSQLSCNVVSVQFHLNFI